LKDEKGRIRLESRLNMRFKWHQKIKRQRKIRKAQDKRRKMKIRKVSEREWQKRRSVRMSRTFFKDFCHMYDQSLLQIEQRKK
jgi:hypothetical protein